MKHRMSLFVFILLFLFSSVTAVAAIEFDLSVFEKNDLFDVEFDEMDDTGEISLKDGGMFVGVADDGSEGMLLGAVDIRVIEDLPPLARVQLLYMGEDWLFVDKVILKPGQTRYTFEVEGKREVMDDGDIMEVYTLVLTDESIGLLKDIIDLPENERVSVRTRLDGKKDWDGELMFPQSSVKALYDAYVESGALNNNFAKIRSAYPCAIK